MLAVTPGGGLGNKPRPALVVQDARLGLTESILVIPFTVRLERSRETSGHTETCLDCARHKRRWGDLTKRRMLWYLPVNAQMRTRRRISQF